MHYYLSRDHLVTGPLRGLVRILRFGGAFSLVAVMLVALRALLPGELFRRWAPAARRLAGRTIRRAAGVRIRARGLLDREPTVVVSNHLSWLDSFVYLGELGPRFVANWTWGAVPVLRTVLRAAGVIFIKRSRLRDLAAVGRRMGTFAARGERTMIFPEADTSRGITVLPFRPGLLEPSAAGGHPVGWAALRYTTPDRWPPASVVVAWADWTPLLLHIYRSFHVPNITAEIVYGEQAVTGAERKELARRLHEKISSAFIPMEQVPESELARISVPPPRPPERF